MERLVVPAARQVHDRDAVPVNDRRRRPVWVVHDCNVPACSRRAWRGLAVVHAALVEAVVTKQAVRDRTQMP